jgi:lactam utilization protein B
VHGDTPGAVNLVKKIRQTLTEENVEVIPLPEFV